MTETLPRESLPILDFIYRGDDASVKITATFPEAIPEQGISAGDPYSLAGKDIYFTAKHKTKDADSAAEFQKTSADGAIVVRDAPDDNICDVTIDGTDTEDMTKAAMLVCDCQVEGLRRWTVWKGYLPVYEDVTRAT